MWADLKLGLRSLRRTPGFAIVAALSLSLGLAAAASLVSVLDALGFRPLPIASPEQLVQINLNVGRETSGVASHADFEAVRRSLGGFTRLAGYAIRGSALGTPGEAPAVVLTGVVTADFFPVAGVTCPIGRSIEAADDRPGSPPVVVLSDRSWRTRFGADRAIVGRSIELNGFPATVIGILPADFTGFRPFVSPEVWVPVRTWSQLLRMSDDAWTRSGAKERVFTLLARRGPDQSLEQLKSQVAAATASLRREFPDARGDVSLLARDEHEVRVGRLAGASLVLWALVDVVILVGCANVAGLLLSRLAARRRELAVRTALGATRGVLVRQLLVESVALALGGAALGLAEAWVLIRLLPSLVPPAALPLNLDFRFDVRVVVATFAASIATVLAFGVWPALSATRVNLTEPIKGTPSDRLGLGRLLARRGLVTAQVAVSFALLVAGALLLRSLWNVERLSPGFEAKQGLVVTVEPGVAGYDMPGTQRLLDDLLARLGATPGVTGVTAARRVPLSPDGGGAAKDVDLPRAADRPDLPPSIHFNSVLPNYFETMGTRIIEGSGFASRITASDPKVVVVNEAMARRYWPNESPIGRTLRVLGPGPSGAFTIVGVAETGKYLSLTEPPDPYLFFALGQMPTSEPTIVIRTAGDPGLIAPAVRLILRDLDPRLPTLQMITLDQHMGFALYEPRFMVALIGTLGLFGLALSLTGLYAVMAFVVASRQREFGVRLALGAEPADLIRHVLRQGARLIGAGLAVGAPLALIATQAMTGSLVGLTATDPVTYLPVAALLSVVGLAAVWHPARRASRTDPASVLKAD
ncbi:MAG TPA: ABC transporter permease [Vicinamibacterales bacterium]|nr:ABC transporter permease [Vicinamibacterales bacterium]